MRIYVVIYYNAFLSALIFSSQTHLQMGAICQPDDVVLPAPGKKTKKTTNDY